MPGKINIIYTKTKLNTCTINFLNNLKCKITKQACCIAQKEQNKLRHSNGGHGVAADNN